MMKKLFAMILIAVLALATVGYAEETSASDNSYNVGDSVYFGHYEQDGDMQNGAEAIEWKILAAEDSRALVVSAKGLAAMSYSEPMNVEAYSDQNLSWETSYIRAWLNDDFLNAAFSEEEKGSILVSELNQNDATGSYTTKDRVFCLSIKEAETYFGNSASMACKVSDYARESLSVDQGAITSDGYGCWWLRDMTSAAKPQKQSNFMTGKSNEAGYISGSSGLKSAKEGKGMPVFCDYLCTARPAMWIDLTSDGLVAVASEADDAPTYVTLEKGAKGDAVKALQERLNLLGYDLGTADGDFGNKTKTAVESFQKQNDLTVTGVADPEMQALLFSDAAKEAPVVRKLNKTFTVDGLEITLTSTSFTGQYNLGSINANPQGVYLCVKATVTNNTGRTLSSKTNDMYCFTTYWNGEDYYGTFFPTSAKGYDALMWGLTDNSVSAGKTLDMVYLVDLPKEAKSSGSIVLEFKDGTNYIVR